MSYYDDMRQLYGQAAAAKQRRQEEEEKEEESMAREKTIGSGALLAPVTATRCCLQLAFRLLSGKPPPPHSK